MRVLRPEHLTEVPENFLQIQALALTFTHWILNQWPPIAYSFPSGIVALETHLVPGLCLPRRSPCSCPFLVTLTLLPNTNFFFLQIPKSIPIPGPLHWILDPNIFYINSSSSSCVLFLIYQELLHRLFGPRDWLREEERPPFVTVGVCACLLLGSYDHCSLEVTKSLVSLPEIQLAFPFLQMSPLSTGP